MLTEQNFTTVLTKHLKCKNQYHLRIVSFPFKVICVLI